MVFLSSFILEDVELKDVFPFEMAHLIWLFFQSYARDYPVDGVDIGSMTIFSHFSKTGSSRT